MKRVVVTGSSGFVAGHTIPLLRVAGYKVVPYDLKIGLDVCDREALRSVLTPGCKVLHLAAVSRFSDADDNPPEAYRTNVGGVATVLSVALEQGAERVVLASTGSVYMPAWCIPITEHHPVSGNSHYGLSKAMGERMAGLCGQPFVMLRYAHLFGPDKRTGGLIDNFLSRVSRGLKPVLYGGWQSNDFCYVQDVARANLLALETSHLNEAFNIGSGVEVTTEEAYEAICRVTGYTGGCERAGLRVVDAPRFVFSIEKARRLLGYMPGWSFEDGLRDMMARGAIGTAA